MFVEGEQDILSFFKSLSPTSWVEDFHKFLNVSPDYDNVNDLNSDLLYS